MSTQIRIGLDIGGTFTDVVLEAGGRRHTAKVLTMPQAPELGAMQALEAVLAKSGHPPGAAAILIHGTTLATNALIERAARTALLTTEGYRDSIEIGTEGRPDQYDVNLVKLQPLVPRRWRFPVRERLDAQGRVLVALDPAEIEAIAERLRAEAIEACAIGFLHSYRDPRHERAARDLLEKRLPGLHVTLSSEVSPEFREFERFSTACANAYIQPLMDRYLGRFEQALAARGFRCPMLLMLSGGGLTTVETARRLPVRLVESGPAGGALFAAGIAARTQLHEVLSFDMGGTTAKICLIDGGKAQTSRSFEVARVYRFKKGSGIPLRVPVIELVEIGAGGGSIGRLDSLGRIAVGPESAGAAPGPACYGQGGESPAVTDADLALGKIDPEAFAAGRMPLSAQAAQRALAQALGEPLGVSAEAAAFGMAEVVDENMAGAARVHAIESGKSLPGRTLIAFGGAAPLHAARLARKLDIERVLIPVAAGVGSAVGFLRAPIAFEVVRTYYQRLASFERDAVEATLAAMQDEAQAEVVRAVGGDARLDVRRIGYMRYAGQGHEIMVRLPGGPLPADAGERLRERFEQAYVATYGRGMPRADVECVSWSVTVSTDAYADPVGAAALVPRQARPYGSRAVFDPGRRARVDYALHRRADLAAGARVAGPAIVVEDDTSTVVSEEFDAWVNAFGDLELVRRGAPGRKEQGA